MKIATWNVNSIKARLPNVLAWLGSAAPDVVLLQEIKSMDEAFPRLEIEDLGYTIETHGQKTYNGVAILSKHGIEDVRRSLPGDDGDEQARYIEGIVGGTVRVASIYLPNGNPAPGPKYDYKLNWMDRLHDHARDLLALEERLVLAGDYNAIPQPEDCYSVAAWSDDALYLPKTRQGFRRLLGLGLTDAFRAIHPTLHAYSFWDYQGGRWQKDEGIRIDHLLLSPQAADRLSNAGIDKAPRGEQKASDHTPVWCTLDA